MNHERRRWVIAGAAMLAAPAVVFAQRCRVTPRDALGPYYKPGAPAEPELCAKGYATRVTQLYFAREGGVPKDLVVTAVPKDGALAASFDVTLAKLG